MNDAESAWEELQRRAAESTFSGIRADSDDEVDPNALREAAIQPNASGSKGGNKGGQGGMMPPMMGGAGGAAGRHQAYTAAEAGVSGGLQHSARPRRDRPGQRLRATQPSRHRDGLYLGRRGGDVG